MIGPKLIIEPPGVCAMGAVAIILIVMWFARGR
jgi:hypothetical protein